MTWHRQWPTALPPDLPFDGSDTGEVAAAVPGLLYTALDLVDVDGDDDLDVVLGGLDTSTLQGLVAWVANDRAAGPAAAVFPAAPAALAAAPALPSAVLSLVLLDVDGDGRRDDAVLATATEVWLVRGVGTPAPASALLADGAFGPGASVRVADLDADGDAVCPSASNPPRLSKVVLCRACWRHAACSCFPCFSSRASTRCLLCAACSKEKWGRLAHYHHCAGTPPL